MLRWLLALVALVLSGCRASGPPQKSEVGYFYWHSPFELTEPDATLLRENGISLMFVRAGTISEEQGHYSVVLPQSFRGGQPGFALHLVFNLDADLVRDFDQVKIADCATTVLGAYKSAKQAAERSGWTVRGLQIDFDVPTRLLNRYADLLTALRKDLAKGQELSITGLITWYTSKDIDAVLEPLDFAVPQFYEGSVGKTVDAATPIGDLANFERHLEAVDSRGKPFFVGLPIYGHAVLYDKNGTLAGMYQGLSVEEIDRHPSFMGEPLPDDRGGEAMRTYLAMKPARDGTGLGFRIVYNVPQPGMLRLHLEKLRAAGPRNCRGMILFRFPEEREASTLPLQTTVAILADKEPNPELALASSIKKDPYAVIEGRNLKSMPLILNLTWKNNGNAPTAVGPDAVHVELEFDRPGVRIEAGSFPRYQALPDTSDAETHSIQPLGERINPLTATRFSFDLGFLPLGASATIGPIRVQEDGPTNVKIVCTFRAPGGYHLIEAKPVSLDLTTQP